MFIGIDVVGLCSVFKEYLSRHLSRNAGAHHNSPVQFPGLLGTQPRARAFVPSHQLRLCQRRDPEEPENKRRSRRLGSRCKFTFTVFVCRPYFTATCKGVSLSVPMSLASLSTTAPYSRRTFRLQAQGVSGQRTTCLNSVIQNGFREAHYLNAF